MNKLFHNKAFRFGFSAGFLLFFIAHLLDFLLLMSIEEPKSSNISIGSIYYFGFPFPIFEWNHYSPIARQFYIKGLIANILVAVIFSFVIGLIFKFVWLKISAKKLR